jgi:glycosyltransferase involved in cell wall biosynthesis
VSAPSAAPAASIIIRALDEARAIEGVLTSVLGQKGIHPLEIIVIDSGSTDGTPEIVRRHRLRLHSIDRAAFTFGSALNLGARLAQAPVCVHLSAHSPPAGPGWLQHLLAPLADPRVVATYGRQRPVPGVNPYEEIEMERAFPPRPPADGERRYFSNANCAIRRAVLLARPFDETITSMEDALWLQELAPAARVVYVPEAEVFHSHPLRPAYWYARYWRDGVAYRYLALRRGIDLLPERSLRPVHRLVGLAGELAFVTTRLAARGRWYHAAAYPFFCALRELALRRGLRHGRRLYTTPPSSAAPQRA